MLQCFTLNVPCYNLWWGRNISTTKQSYWTFNVHLTIFTVLFVGLTFKFNLIQWTGYIYLIKYPFHRPLFRAVCRILGFSSISHGIFWNLIKQLLAILHTRSALKIHTKRDIHFCRILLSFWENKSWSVTKPQYPSTHDDKTHLCLLDLQASQVLFLQSSFNI